MTSPILAEPNEALDDVLSLCAKVCVIHESTGRVHVNDLVSLRNTITAIRTHVANGGGYASIPRLVSPKEER
jgi:hypothetical protein